MVKISDGSVALISFIALVGKRTLANKYYLLDSIKCRIKTIIGIDTEIRPFHSNKRDQSDLRTVKETGNKYSIVIWI